MNNAEGPAGPRDDEGPLEPLFTAMRLAVGIAFLAGGLFLYYSVISALLGLLNGTTSYPLMEKFASSDARTITLPHLGEQVSLPPVFFLGMGYGVIAFIAWIVVSIANNLIRGAVNLIQPDARILIRRLRRELKSTATK